jgi:hypothetical protein
MAKKFSAWAVVSPVSGQYSVRFMENWKAEGECLSERFLQTFNSGGVVRHKPSNFARPLGRCPYLKFPTDGLTGPVDSRITSSGSTVITSRGSTVS